MSWNKNVTLKKLKLTVKLTDSLPLEIYCSQTLIWEARIFVKTQRWFHRPAGRLSATRKWFSLTSIGSSKVAKAVLLVDVESLLALNLKCVKCKLIVEQKNLKSFVPRTKRDYESHFVLEIRTYICIYTHGIIELYVSQIGSGHFDRTRIIQHCGVDKSPEIS